MIASILEEILLQKRKELVESASRVSLQALKDRARILPPPAGFVTALEKQTFGIIAEIKRASPSKGIIRADLKPVETARAFIENGAACLSVLTDEKFFQGSLQYLREIKHAFPKTPVLRKDFTTSAYHIWEAREAGADAVLLIAAALSPDELRALMEETLEADLDVLVEVHNSEELAIAHETMTAVFSGKEKNRALLGINNRDLMTFRTDVAVSERLLAELDQRELGSAAPKFLRVSESGLKTAGDLVRLNRAGARAFLIGESLVASGDPGENLRVLLQETVRLSSSQ